MSELANRYFETTTAFIQKRGFGIDVTNVSLAETFRDVPTNLWGFFPLYPSPSGEMSYALFSEGKDRDPSSLPQKILAYTVTNRVKRLNIPSLPETRRTMELFCIAQGLPSIVIALGEQENPNQEVALLFAVYGYSVEEALAEAQKAAHKSNAKRN